MHLHEQVLPVVAGHVAVGRRLAHCHEVELQRPRVADITAQLRQRSGQPATAKGKREPVLLLPEEEEPRGEGHEQLHDAATGNRHEFAEEHEGEVAEFVNVEVRATKEALVVRVAERGYAGPRHPPEDRRAPPPDASLDPLGRCGEIEVDCHAGRSRQERRRASGCNGRAARGAATEPDVAALSPLPLRATLPLS